ncbi:MAG: DUF3127 domain-containing protein [Sphingomonadales bacterium]|nr:DUF3127 domain-containing protein [Sphingomonadales bacterium]
MEVEGTIVQIMPLVSGQSARTGNTWRKQEFLLETSAQYPKKIFMSLMGEKIDQFPLREGERVRVSVDLESREYNGRWYSDIRAWKIAPAGQELGGSFNTLSNMNQGGYTPSTMSPGSNSDSLSGGGAQSEAPDPLSASSAGEDSTGADDLPF